jgi:hypothetical protein
MSNEIINKKLSQTEMILVSLYRAARGTTEKIPEEEIVIEAWKQFPHAFSLRNHPEYPEGSSVSKRMADKLKPQGLVIGLGDNIFRLTDKGIIKARKIISALENVPNLERTAYRHLSRDEENFINHALKTQAFSAWRKNQKGTLIDYDVKLFFKFSTGTKVEERSFKVKFALDSIKKAVDLGINQAGELQQLSAYLLDNFKELFREE